jgi:hypothetical protein
MVRETALRPEAGGRHGRGPGPAWQLGLTPTGPARPSRRRARRRGGSRARAGAALPPGAAEAEVVEDLPNGQLVGHESDQAHALATAGAHERVEGVEVTPQGGVHAGAVEDGLLPVEVDEFLEREGVSDEVGGGVLEAPPVRGCDSLADMRGEAQVIPSMHPVLSLAASD